MMKRAFKINAFGKIFRAWPGGMCLGLFIAVNSTVLASHGAAQAGAASPKASISPDRTKLFLGDKLILDSAADGFMAIHSVRYSPDQAYFAVIGCGYECNDNVGFLVRATGGEKRKFTAAWDFILQDKLEWSADGSRLFYYRINSSGADPPATAPAPGWVEIEAPTGRKSAATNRRLKTTATYGVFRVRADDVLNVRIAPGVKSKAVGVLPHEARGIKVTGAGKSVGRDLWVPVQYQDVTGWVNQSYLFEEFTATGAE